MGIKALRDHPDDLYGDHLQKLQQIYAEGLTANELEGVVIAVGTEPQQHWFDDDSGSPFRANAEAERWLSGIYDDRTPPSGMIGADGMTSAARIDNTGGHFVYVDGKSERPKLFVHSDPDDPWSLPPGVPERASQNFDVEVESDPEKITAKLRELAGQKRVTYLGPESEGITPPGKRKAEGGPQGFISHIDWSRLRKTPYEIACLKEANKRTAVGHQAAKKAFLQGASEGEILLAFLGETRTREKDHSYVPIVAKGDHGSILHFPGANFGKRDGNSVLIDAGVRYRAYNADVTTTYVNRRVNDTFRGVVKGVDTLQKDILSKLKPEADFLEIQLLAHMTIADILIEAGVLRDVTAEAAVANGYTKIFYPHGWGHVLGVQTHDKGLFQLDPQGTSTGKVEDGPLKGALQRGPLGEDYVITNEPGIYFNLRMLRKFEGNPHFNWALILELAKCGGVRIETDVWLTNQAEGGHVDLTRMFLEEGTNA